MNTESFRKIVSNALDRTLKGCTSPESGYTEGISNTQRYKCLGNSFTVPVIKEILKHLKNEGGSFVSWA